MSFKIKEATEGARSSSRAVVAALVAWVPLALLAAAEGKFTAFIADFAAHAKYVVALPVLVLAGPRAASWLDRIARQFIDAGFVNGDQATRLDAVVASRARLRDADAAWLAAIVLAYAIVTVLYFALPDSRVAAWHGVQIEGRVEVSLAGSWLLVVSLPLLLTMIVRWMWRWCLWTWLLASVARMDLKLVASHPDRAAGLMFVAYSVAAWSPAGFALGAVVAGEAANAIAHEGVAVFSYKHRVLETLAASLVLFTAPLLLFTGRLLNAWRRGVFDYALLAERAGHEFERRWLGRAPALDSPDFSTTTDLYQIVERAATIRFAPIELRSIVVLAVATLLPFVPVALMAVPIDTIIDRIADLLL